MSNRFPNSHRSDIDVVSDIAVDGAETLTPAQGMTARGWSRRFFLRSLGYGTVAAAGIGLWGFQIEPYWLSVEHHDLAIRNLPLAMIGKRLVHISDLHAGQTRLSYLQRAMETVNSLEPDILVITGDFVDMRNPSQELTEVLTVLEPATMASLGCLGNHDYGLGYSDEKNANRISDQAANYDIQVLRNQRIEIDGLQIFGLDDFWSPRYEANELLATADSIQPAICLCHNPDVCDHAQWGDFRGVILAGHTHGGQCKPPFLPPPILPVSNRSYTSGFFDLDTQRQLFISRGLGHTLPVRLNCRPEITVFKLVTDHGN